MLEEKNDNLAQNENETDGNVENPNQETVNAENHVEAPTDEVANDAEVAQDVSAPEETVNESADTESLGDAMVAEHELGETPSDETLLTEQNDEPESEETDSPAETESEATVDSPDAQVEDTPEAIIDEITETTADVEPESEEEQAAVETELVHGSQAAPDTEQAAIDAIAETNAEEGEDETLAGRHEIPMQDYEAMPMDKLVSELEILVAVDKVMSVKDHVENLRTAFLSKYNHFIEEKKEEFLAENPDGTEEFHYHYPLKSKFDVLYNQFRDKKNIHFKSLQNNLQANLEKRLAIVEELKELINPQENIKDTLKHFNDLRDRWKNAGPIPKDKYNHVWNNYHFHLENFYDYLHLDREARDIDFKHNLEQKERIITRVEQLVNEPDINKAFRELQDLHKIWKEDIGPVSKDHREDVWNRFSALTKLMHDKRELLFEGQRERENQNLAAKKEIIAKIEALAQEKVTAHASWQGQVEKVEALRNEFFSAGKVPSEVNEETWAAFKTAVRNFNALKNSFYKDIKKDQNDNLNKKQALVERAKALQESEDFAATTPVMKQIQEEWKQVGHVPRKYSDKIWKEFKDACNHYFERLKAQRNEANTEEMEAFEKKKAYIESLKDFEMTGDHKTDLDAIKAHIETWKGLGRVPFSRKHIDGKFNKVLDVLFEKLSLSKKDTDMMRFSNKVEQLSESNDTRKIDNEKIFLMRKIEEVQSEIFQLENNIQFFTNTKNAKKENSIVLEVRKSIERHKDELSVLKDKLKKVRSLGQE
ncbi:DUF349 domain-containing protein [Flavobacterium sp. BFFFF1]|uniref:DUF349 domain-containing protein n=1 Tax=Flavobacterium sp. BFFFF1 TaxID=2015557 RepID=UPI0025C566E0|nr:DUF349 domain-containing protein [Flavobacterium sp. BFFFF1]